MRVRDERANACDLVTYPANTLTLQKVSPTHPADTRRGLARKEAESTVGSRNEKKAP